MNVLAHDLGIPDEIEPALDTLLASPVRMIDTAWVNGQLFLCSSALAVMPHLGRLRERDRASVGWSRPRLWVQALRVWRRYPRARLRLVVDGHEHDVRTRAMVVSNNLLSVRQGRLPGRDRIDAGLLGVYVTRDKKPSDLLVVAAMLLNGRWPTKERLHTFQGRSVQVFSSHLDLTSVMSDGELSQLTMPLRYDITPRALAVLSPLENS